MVRALRRPVRGIAGFLFLLAALLAGALSVRTAAAQTCPPPGDCPSGRTCKPANLHPWLYHCAYPTGMAPGGADGACRSGSYYAYDDEAQMAADHAADLAESFCSNDFALASGWAADSPPSCLLGAVLAESRTLGDQCTGDPSSSALCFLVTPRDGQQCAEEPALWYLNNWLRARSVSCPPGTESRYGTCADRGINERKPDQCSAMTAHPVNALSGNKRLVETDWVDASAAGLLTLRRTYASFSAPDPMVVRWPVGRAWRHTFDRRLHDQGQGGLRTVTAYRADSHVAYFSGFVNGVALQPEERLSLTLLIPPVAGAHYALRDAEDRVEDYDATGRLIAIDTRDGVGVTLSYDAYGRLSGVQDSLGRALSFAYASPSSPRIVAVTLPDGEQIAYGYDGDRLQQATYPGGATVGYDYYPTTLHDETLLRRVYRDGVEYTYYEYATTTSFMNAVRHLATRSRLSAADADYTFSYALNGLLPTSSTTVQTPLGASETLHSVVRNGSLLVAERSAGCSGCAGGGTVRSTVYGADGLPRHSTDFRGVFTDLTYDARGRETERREAGAPATQANGCPTGTTFYPSSFGTGCGNSSCWSGTPFPGSRHGERVGSNQQFFSCPLAPSQPATQPLRTTTTLWHGDFNQPLERTLAGAAGQPESVSRWAYNARGQVLARCDVDPADAVAMAYVCSAAAAPPTGAAVRRWVFDYCEDTDTLLPNSTCPLRGLLRRVNGPRLSSDAGMGGLDDLTEHAYYAATDESGCGVPGGPCHRRGDRHTTTNALGQVSEILAYDKAGRIVAERDANGTLTTSGYHPRGWLAARTVHAGTGFAPSAQDATTHFLYDGRGRITRATLPNGVATDYHYDAADRLTDIVDALDHRVHYTLDRMGNRIVEETFDASYDPGIPGQGLTRRIAREYNLLGRLVRQLNANNGVTEDSTPYDAAGLADGYDGNGNRVLARDGLGIATRQSYDTLSRLVQILQDHAGAAPATADTATGYAYDARDNLRSVTDPDQLVTAYGYDGLGNQITLDSPDTGHSDYAYDRAGNRISETDQRGVTKIQVYDALNRLVGTQYPDTALNIAYRYDEPDATTGCTGSSATGWLTRMTDATGTTTYCYDRRGNVLRKTQQTVGTTLITAYAYDLADQLSAITYPSGAVVSYSRDVAGRLAGLQWQASPAAVPVAIIAQASYYPFGPLRQLTYGGGRTLTKTRDQDYRVDAIESSAAGGLVLDFATDALGNIVGLSDSLGQSPPDRSYGYDALNRLIRADDAAGNLLEAYTYGKTGDRLSKQLAGQPTQTYTYATGSHRLASVGGAARSHDTNGNTTDRGDGIMLSYGDQNRLSGAAVPGNATSYAYSGRGERLHKSQANAGTPIDHRYVFNETGQLLYDRRDQTSGSATVEYLYFDDLPVAQVRNGTISYLETDHLGTPRLAAEPSTGATQWYWPLLGSSFGEHAAVTIAGGTSVDLRYPGQGWDGETGLHYNYFRDYDPRVGRYVESDPIGLDADPNTYAYGLSSPLTNFDPDGLAAQAGTGAAAAIAACLRIPACRRAVTDALKACKDVRCKLTRHKAHHKFPLLGYCEHMQIICFVKGGSVLFRAQFPLPGRCSREKSPGDWLPDKGPNIPHDEMPFGE